MKMEGFHLSNGPALLEMLLSCGQINCVSARGCKEKANPPQKNTKSVLLCLITVFSLSHSGTSVAQIRGCCRCTAVKNLRV